MSLQIWIILFFASLIFRWPTVFVQLVTADTCQEVRDSAIGQQCKIQCHMKATVQRQCSSGGGMVDTSIPGEPELLEKLCRNTDLTITTTIDLECGQRHLSDNVVAGLPLLRNFQPYRNLVRSANYSNNRLRRVMAKFFDGMNGLEKVILSHNIIYSVDIDAFSALVNLTVLDLSNNKIKILPEHLFKSFSRGQGHLRNLDLSFNEKGVTLVMKLLVPLKHSLKSLALNGLDLTEVPKNFIHHLEKLESLSLAYNRITSLQDDSFFDHRERHWTRRSHSEQYRISLNVAHNHIQSVGNYTFSRLKLPITIDLRDNYIKTPYFLLHPTMNSQFKPCMWESSTVNLYKNPIICTCELFKLARYKITGANIQAVCANAPYNRSALHGWIIGHEHSTRYFEALAYKDCEAYLKVPRNKTQSQYSCRCKKWFKHEQYLDDQTCQLKPRAKMYSHDEHTDADHDHEHPYNVRRAVGKTSPGKSAARWFPNLLLQLLLLHLFAITTWQH